MNYIVDPNLIYLLTVVDWIKFFIGIMTAFLIVGFGVLVGCAIYNYVESENPRYRDETRKWNRKWYKWCKQFAITVGVFMVISIALTIFIPSKNTIITMEIAKAATYENVELGVQQLKEAVDYVINAINSLK